MSTIDEKRIRKLYGEKMWHLCRKLFPTILENEGMLSSIIEKYFYPSKFLYDDIIDNHMEERFKEYIWNFYSEEVERVDTGKTVEELLLEKGYVLYECKTEEEIQYFRKYYAKDEVLCTITERNRLDRCHVFFAIRKDAGKLKREDFKNPKRQDEYGTSVLSIQFTRGKTNGLSIKNRYNDTVPNPDATYSNNLDNINVGLTAAFEKEYGFRIRHSVIDKFELPNYVIALGGKHYRYNYKVKFSSTYYCPDNVVISNGIVQKKYLEKEKYLVFDCYILDLVNKKIKSPDVKDSFIDTLKDIKDIKIKNIGDGKEIFILFEDSSCATIVIDKYSRITEYKNEKATEIGDNFLSCNNTLKKLSMPNVEKIGDHFLDANDSIVEISFPNVIIIGNDFMPCNNKLKIIDMPNVEKIGENFLYSNKTLTKIDFPNLVEIGNCFMCCNNSLNSVVLTILIKVGDAFLYSNNSLTEIVLPNVEFVGEEFMFSNTVLNHIEVPKLEAKGVQFLIPGTNRKK